MANHEEALPTTATVPPPTDDDDDVVEEERHDTVPAMPGKSPRTTRRAKQLSTKSLNWGVPADTSATQHVMEEHGEDSWQFRVLKKLHNPKVQIFFAGLLLLDVLIIFAELALLTLFPTCDLVERDAISCCPVAAEDSPAARFLSEASHEDFCAPGLEAFLEYEAGCDEHKHENIHKIETFLFSLTLAILSTFFLELTLMMVALKPRIFFRQIFYALDYVIVSVSLALEATFHALGDDVLQSLIGLVIMGRVWRFIRIGHGIVEISEELAHEREEHLLTYVDELEDILHKNNLPLPIGEIRPLAGSKHSEIIERLDKRRRDKERDHYHRKISSGSA
jgi:hypothetical protein